MRGRVVKQVKKGVLRADYDEEIDNKVTIFKGGF